MKNLSLYHLIFVLLFITACNKKNDPTASVEKAFRDSLSFEINGKAYSYNGRFLVGSGNRQINLKPYDSMLEGRRLARGFNGHYWYGAVDSILYEARFESQTSLESGQVNVIFTKQFKTDQLKKNIFLFVPTDNKTVIKAGQVPFAVDYEQENTTEGVVVEANLNDIAKSLTSYIPTEEAVRVKKLKKDLQNNSSFEIIRLQKLSDSEKYLVEARFELNLYDDTAKMYRLEKGFMRLLTDMVPRGAF